MNPLEKIRRKKEVLKKDIKLREERLAGEINYLESNFGKMAIDSILPFNTGQIEKASGIFNTINETVLKVLPSSVSDEKKQKYASVMKSAEMLVAGLTYKYLTRFLR